MEFMKEREKSHMIPPLLAATYLDKEYQVLLTKEQGNSAKLELQALCLYTTSATETPRGQLVH